MNPTHVITTVEAVNLAEEAKKFIQQKETASQFITRTLQKATYERLYDLFDKNFDENMDDFDELIRITEASKDMGFTDQSGDFLQWIKENHAVRYQEYLAGKKSDHSAASDQDER